MPQYGIFPKDYAPKEAYTVVTYAQWPDSAGVLEFFCVVEEGEAFSAAQLEEIAQHGVSMPTPHENPLPSKAAYWAWMNTNPFSETTNPID